MPATLGRNRRRRFVLTRRVRFVLMGAGVLAAAAVAALSATAAARSANGYDPTAVWLTTRSPAEANLQERPSQTHLDPPRFAELATGIVLVRDFNCRGTPTFEGTGFLIGSRVVMTAAHVVQGACSTKIRTSGGTWLPSPFSE